MRARTLGLVPSWAKDLTFGTRCINARAESLHTAPAFVRLTKGGAAWYPPTRSMNGAGPKADASSGVSC